MREEKPAFEIEVENVTGLCPAGERYAAEQMREGRIPVLCCEGPCIRGEIARQAAHQIGKQPPFARACQGEAVAVPDSGMARWVREAKHVVVVDGCFLRCQARSGTRTVESGIYEHPSLVQVPSYCEGAGRTVGLSLAPGVAEFDQVRGGDDHPDVGREGKAGAGYRGASLGRDRGGRERDRQDQPGTASGTTHDVLLGEGWGLD